MPDDKKKKETRFMKVTMDADEFEKFDKGETHSDKGVRNEKGKLSTLPDIAPVSDSDLPKRTVVRTQKIYVEPKEPTLGQMVKQEIKDAIVDEVYDAIHDPRKRAKFAYKTKQIWRDYIKPAFSSVNERPKYKTKDEQILSERESQEQAEVEYQVETVNDNQERIVVTGEQAEMLVEAMRQKAKELSAMIYLLSTICVKDEKTDSEYVLEEAYFKQLVSEEATSTMRTLVAHRQLLDEGTAMCFEDWLNGYVRNGNQRVPIPALIEEEREKRELKTIYPDDVSQEE